MFHESEEPSRLRLKLKNFRLMLHYRALSFDSRWWLQERVLGIFMVDGWRIFDEVRVGNHTI